MISDKKYSQLGLHDSEFPESTLTGEEEIALFLSNSRKPDRKSEAQMAIERAELKKQLDVCSGCADSSINAGGRTGRVEEAARAEQAKLIASAKAHGFFYEDESPLMRAVMAHENRGGTEHDAYIVGDANNRVVIRSTANSGFGLTSSDSPAQYLKRMEDYNATFPLLQIRVIGVSQNSDGVPVIWTAQSFVPGEKFKNHDELTAAFAKKGWFEMPGTSFRYQHKESGAVIDDAHIFNVLHIGEKLYPIDIIVKEVPNNGGVIKFSRSGVNNNATTSQQPP